MNKDYYKYKKYKKLYKKQKLTVGGTNNCNDITKTQKETFQAWKTRCRGNQLCVINNKSRKCQVNPTNITINIKEMTGESYHVMINSPYTVDVLVKRLPLEKRRCQLFRAGTEDKLGRDMVLQDEEHIFMLVKPPVTPIIERDALRELVEIWCQGGFTEELLETYGHISEWDVGNVTDMNGVFSDWYEDEEYTLYITNTFNDDISEWKTANVTNMYGMFQDVSSFNQNLDGWNVNNVTNMKDMFWHASSFNQPLDSWKTANVTSMSGMFADASSFNQSLNSWKTANVTDMMGMFDNASSFNQPLDSWKVGNVTDMMYMFDGADNFDPTNAPWYNL